MNHYVPVKQGSNDTSLDPMENVNYLSESFSTLVQQLSTNTELQARQLHKQSSHIQPFMQGYQYEVSSWPVIINKKLVFEIEKVFRAIPLIFHKVLKHSFTQNRREACDYLNIQEWAADLFCEEQLELNDILTRYDAVISDKQLKLIELNAGGSLGGWQLSFLESEAYSALKCVSGIDKWEFTHQNVVRNLFNAYCQSILRLKGREARGNILFFLPESLVRPEVASNVKESFLNIYKEVRPNQLSQGKLFFFTNHEEVEANEDGNVIYENEVMDAVILTIEGESDLPSSFLALLESASHKKQFYYPDAFCLSVYSNKLIFAYLHEPYIQALLTPQQKMMVDSYIPWTIKATRESICINNDLYLTKQYVIENKDLLVLKKAHSMQGKDVLVGLSMPLTEWEVAFDEIKMNSDWIIQQYCPPDPILTVGSKYGLGEYDMVWGLFSLQGKFSGGFIRGVRTMSGSKVINSARGACEFLLLEQENKKNKITL